MLLSGSNDEQPFRNSATNDVPITDTFPEWKNLRKSWLLLWVTRMIGLFAKRPRFNVSTASTLPKE